MDPEPHKMNELFEAEKTKLLLVLFGAILLLVASCSATPAAHAPPRSPPQQGATSPHAGVPSRPVPASTTVTLTGKALTLAQVRAVATRRASVEMDPAAMQQVQMGYDLLMASARAGTPIYGLNVGVGLNKDKTIFRVTDGKKELTPEVLELSRRFNANSMRAHSAGVGPELPSELVRAAMLIRLNTMLTGRSGAQPRVADLYRAFLNEDVVPVVPSRGSVGECDITLASHIGLVMMGEWQADVRGKRVSGAAALSAVGAAPLVPLGKDALAVLSTNAMAAGRAALAAHEASHLLRIGTLVFTASLEGLNGNIAPFLPAVSQVRPFAGPSEISRRILANLLGSYLLSPHPDRPLQDPLSFRTTAYALGTALEALEDVQKQLILHINSSDDNPAVVADLVADGGTPEQARGYYVTEGQVRGAVLPTANFDPLPLVVAVERLDIALSHVSQHSTMRILKLSDPAFTKLSRFLAPDGDALAFSAIQKVFVALEAENRDLANPVSLDLYPAAE